MDGVAAAWQPLLRRMVGQLRIGLPHCRRRMCYLKWTKCRRKMKWDKVIKAWWLNLNSCCSDEWQQWKINQCNILYPVNGLPLKEQQLSFLVSQFYQTSLVEIIKEAPILTNPSHGFAWCLKWLSEFLSFRCHFPCTKQKAWIGLMEQGETVWIKRFKFTLNKNLKVNFCKMVSRWYMTWYRLAKMYRHMTKMLEM